MKTLVIALGILVLASCTAFAQVPGGPKLSACEATLNEYAAIVANQTVSLREREKTISEQAAKLAEFEKAAKKPDAKPN